MTTLIICEHGDLSPELTDCADLIDTEIGKYIRATRNEEKRTERLAAYLTLRAYLSECGIELSDLLHGTRGEPIATVRGKENRISVSLSHEHDLLAVAISDARVGVDVECEIDPERAERIEERFIKGREIEGAVCEMNDHLLVVSRLTASGELLVSDRLTIKPKAREKTDDNNVYVNNNLHIYRCDPLEYTTVRWTSLEAVLKLFGGGFADFLNTGAIAQHSRLASYKIKRGDEHLYVSLATELAAGA